ncbi:stage V sporulation protein B [Paenactinomyces guangxiensis]|uniref:Stage V sporulation protein B n=1 Tax=Paenactinomyces guangxiensis TaxID=1490290 RepID=A0A7W1WTK4_9BACL|nr:stage V sporulation protein B [Paenactinomyces guangxiensis]MBA4495748.1 stage V sporulation protein B [Paenactinomyces guangxiensis]MBH8592737.1 stage V sporulation protein B [Paenactinomyces guangxiensis]
MSKQGFLYGTLVLVGAGFITKVLGFIYRIALSRIIGDEGMGLFQMAFPILIFTIVITTAGLPVAISKLVSEAEAKNEEYRIRSILIVSILIVIITSVVITSGVLLAAPIIASTLLTDERAIYSLLAIAPMIPIIAISSIFRGYFQGRQHMSPYATSMIIEQFIRIFTVLLLAQYLLPIGIEYAAAGAMIGMVIGEFAGMMFLIYSFKKDPKRPSLHFSAKKEKKEKSKGFLRRFGSTTRDLLGIAIPVSASRTVGSLSYAIEPIVVSQSLAMAGIATATATALYGRLEGMALPLVFFPSFFAYSISVSLVPAISEAAAQKNIQLVEYRFQQAFRLALIVCSPCSLMMFVMAEPLSVLLYHQAEVARLMQIIAPFAIFAYLQGPFASVLQGLDQARVAMRNSIIGAIVKTGLIFVLASRPELGIDGVALAINCGMIIVTVLHFIAIAKIIPFTLRVQELLKLGIAIIITGLVAKQLLLQEQIPLLSRTMLTTIGSVTVYLICMFVLSLIRKDDVSRIPYVGKWMSNILPR